MQNIIKYKYSLIVAIVLLVIPFLGNFIFPYQIWNRIFMVLPMFILFYGESFPFSMLITLFITLPIYLFGILGLLVFLFSKGKYRFLLKAMLFAYLGFFMLFGAIGLASLIGAFYLNNPEAIDFESILSILATIIWGTLTYKAAIKLDAKTNLTPLTN